MNRLTLEAVPEEMQDRVLSYLVPGETLADIDFITDAGLILVCKKLGEGIQVLGCSDCIGLAEPPSIPFSALTADETKFTAFADIRLCRTCQSRLKIT